MRKIKKAWSSVLIAAVCLALTACSLPFGQKIPETTSEDWGLYTQYRNGINTIVNEDGELSFDYSFDKKGNAVDKNKTIIIGKDNLSEFVSVRDIRIDDSEFSEVELDTMIVSTESSERSSAGTPMINEEKPVESTMSVSFSIDPVFATCRKVKIESSNPAAVSVSGAGEDGAVTVSTDDRGTGKFDLTFKKDGAVLLTVSSADGNCEKNFNIHVTLNDTPVNADEFRHEMTPLGSTSASAHMATEPQSNAVSTNPVVAQQETVVVTSSIQTTENTPGWINGSKVNLREQPSTSSNVIDTYATGKSLTILGNANGWTKVQIDGQTGYLKTVYVTTVNPNQSTSIAGGNTSAGTNTGRNSGTVVYGQPTGGSTGTSAYYNSGTNYGNRTATGSAGTGAAAVNAPIASNDGMDHGYAFSSPAAPVGNSSHAHDFKVAESVPPSGTESGYTTYKCSCGVSYKGPYTAAGTGSGHVHSYSGNTVEPTCESIGYTEHRCASCGDEFRDSFIPATGHSFSSTELPDGAVRHTCDICGYFYEDAAE